MSKYWEDFQKGERFDTQGLTLTETHLVNWASLTGDWFELHTNEEYAKKTPFGGRIAHGPLVFALALGLVTRREYVGDAVMAFLGIDKLRAVAPVRIGDTIHTEVEFFDKRETQKPDRGIMVLRNRAKNQRNEVVMEFDLTAMFNRAPK
jgi:acyl dehydratase